MEEQCPSEKEQTVFEPDDNMIAALKLELKRPVFLGDTSSTRAWQEIRSAQRAAGQAVQRAVGDVVVHIRSMRKAGKIRFANRAEQMQASKLPGGPLPEDCYTKNDLDTLYSLVSSAFRESGLSEYVYSSISQRILQSEFTKSKLAKLLSGEIAYPVFHNIGIMMRSRNWQLRFTEGEYQGKQYLDIEIEICSIRKGLGRMVLHCAALHGRQLARVKPILEALQVMGESITGTLDSPARNWKKGALTLRAVNRPGQPIKWQLLLPYTAPRVDSSGGQSVIVVHRSVVNMLSAAVENERGKHVLYYPGRTIVALKHQMYARRAALSQDIASKPHRGRGGKAHYKALHRLADKEARATQTELWRAARWVQNIVERYGAKAVYLDDFGTFDPDRPGPPFEPYVRRFPFADLKLKIIDAVRRRAGVLVELKPAKYLSQRCPACGKIDAKNVVRLPVVKGIQTESGRFKCTSCKYEDHELDHVAVLNQLLEWTTE
jgi:hypothetical protein